MAVYQVADALPLHYEVLATIKVVKPAQGWGANSCVIFDHQSATNFKFAGLNVSTNKLEMGQRTAAGWQVLGSRRLELRPELGAGRVRVQQLARRDGQHHGAGGGSYGDGQQDR